MLRGVDISHFQGDINFDLLKQNCDFCIIAAGYGVEVDGNPAIGVDSKFHRNIAEAQRVGISFQLYHFSYCGYNSPEDEALNMANVATQNGVRDKFLWLDYENFDKFTGDHQTWALAFLKRYALLTGQKPGIYLNKQELLNHDYSKIRDAGHKLWYAQYPGGNPDLSKPPVFQNWHPSLWQFTDAANVPGFNGGVDLSVSYEEGGDIQMPIDNLKVVYLALTGAEIPDEVIKAWTTAGSPDPLGWTKAYVLGDRHSDVFHQLEQSLSVHDTFDLPRLTGEAKVAQKEEDDVLIGKQADIINGSLQQIADLKAQLAQGGIPMPTATTPGPQTSEFKITVVTMVISALAALLGVVDPTSLPQWVQAIVTILGSLGVVLPPMVYSLGRSQVKAAALTAAPLTPKN